jgi:hypothetical protein
MVVYQQEKKRMFIMQKQMIINIERLKFIKHQYLFLKIVIDMLPVNIVFDMDIQDIIQEKWFDYGQKKNIEIYHVYIQMEFHVQNQLHLKIMFLLWSLSVRIQFDLYPHVSSDSF